MERSTKRWKHLCWVSAIETFVRGSVILRRQVCYGDRLICCLSSPPPRSWLKLNNPPSIDVRLPPSLVVSASTCQHRPWLVWLRRLIRRKDVASDYGGSAPFLVRDRCPPRRDALVEEANWLLQLSLHRRRPRFYPACVCSSLMGAWASS